MWQYLLARLREPSTYLGLMLTATNVGAAAQSHNWNAVGAAIGGVLGMVLPEGATGTAPATPTAQGVTTK